MASGFHIIIFPPIQTSPFLFGVKKHRYVRSRGLLSDLVPQPYFLSELLAREPQELIWSEAAAKLRQVKGMLPRRAEAEWGGEFFCLVWTLKKRGKLHPGKRTAGYPKWMGFGRGN